MKLQMRLKNNVLIEAKIHSYDAKTSNHTFVILKRSIIKANNIRKHLPTVLVSVADQQSIKFNITDSKSPKNVPEPVAFLVQLHKCTHDSIANPVVWFSLAITSAFYHLQQLFYSKSL